MKAAWLLLFTCLTGLQAWQGYLRLQKESKRVESQQGLARLAQVTVNLFPTGRPPMGNDFWKAIGRESPMLDPWGRAYVLENPMGTLYRWRGAGPDGGYDTGDDLVATIPYGLQTPQPEEPGRELLPVIDAK